MTSRPTIKTARRSTSAYSVNLGKRRNWYTDPPAGDPPAPPTPPAAPPTPDPKGEAKFTQAELDAIAGRTRKEAADSATKKLLEALGADPTDEKALDNIKALLAEGKQAKDAKKSAEQKLQEQIDALTKERDDAKALATASEEKRKATLLDTRLETLASKSGAQFPDDVINYARRNYAEKVTALMADDGKVDEKKAGELIEDIKKARPNFFDSRKGAGTGSHGGGRSDNGDSESLRKIAQDESFRRARRAT